MRLFKRAMALSLAALGAASLTLAPTAASAASAHNSQAGANGDTTNASAPLHKHNHVYQRRG